MMIVPNATSPEDALRRAKECRTDVSSCTFYPSPVLACAPYIVCNAKNK
jgi:hypothetical protein